MGTAADEHSARPVTTDKIRVLFLHTATRPPLGADTWIHGQIMRDLDRSTHDVYAACAPGKHGAPTPTYQLLAKISDLQLRPVHLGPELSGRSPAGKARALFSTMRAGPSLAALAVFVRRKRVQVIHTSDRPRDAFASVLLARLTGVKCIIHAHVGYGEWMSPLLKWSLRRADALIAVSEFVADTLVGSGHDRAKIHVVLNAIVPTEWSPGAGRDDIRRELGLPADAPVVVTVCRLFPAKGAGELIRAMSEVRHNYPDVRLLIVGSEMEPGYQNQLEQLARQLNVADNVVFTGRRSDVARLMAAADIFAMPSLGEPFGLVFLEAMAMMLPVVALDSGGAPEVIEHDITGLLSAPGDLPGLSEHLLALLRDPARRQRLGLYGRRRVEQHFSTQRMAYDTERVHQRLTTRQAIVSNIGRGGHERLIGRSPARHAPEPQ